MKSGLAVMEQAGLEGVGQDDESAVFCTVIVGGCAGG